MFKNDNRLMTLQDLSEALVLLTRFPVRAGKPRGVISAWAWPLAGVAVAIVGAVIVKIALAIGLSAGTAAWLATGAMILTTGAMHEDGLADCTDGFWGGHDPERRLAIMKDSAIGTYGVLALVIAIGVQWQALTALFSAGHVFAPLVAAAALSRAPMVALMHAMPAARPTGLSGGYGRPSQDTAYIAIIWAGVVALLFAGFSAMAATVVVGATGLVIAAIAKNKIGGQTGDVLGATQKLSEIAVYVCLAALWA